VGVLRQDHFQYETVPILHTVMMGHRELWSALEEKEAVLAADEFDADRYGDLEDLIVSQDGYGFEARCAEILEGLGIPTPRHLEPMSTLSGGFKLRVLLAQTLAADPGCLLLDEPTNHLDILSIRWLETFLVDYAGCAVVISHDHRFLNNVCSHILDVDYETVMLYTGNYTRFTASKEAERARKEAEIAKQEKEIAQREKMVERFRAKASKARQAQSWVKQLERVTVERLPPTSRRYPVFAFRQRRPSGKTVLEIEGLRKSYGDLEVLHGVDLVIRRGDRLAIIGPNGIGKSTLLKILIGHLEADAGVADWGHETHPGYFAQDHQDIFGGRTGTVEGFLGEAAPGRDVGWVRGQLGKVLFSRDEVEKRLNALSGGEAARLLFARLAVEEPNVLVLDEPTNHLDLEAIEALCDALRAYDGSLIFVSHDRWFVSQLATRILEITPDGMTDFPGTYAEYLERCGDDHLDADVALRQAREVKRGARKKASRRTADPDEREAAKRAKELALRVEVIEQAIEAAEQRIQAIDERFCRPDFIDTTPPERIAALKREQDDLRSRSADLTEEWEQLTDDLVS
jgi:ATPase subunit of ABC transporter with duplicated ATPase domains